jgi:UDP-N-acetylmuramoyl-L-alanyl-D-glutamate--2,6-diaminopimelate ligase
MRLSHLAAGVPDAAVEAGGDYDVRRVVQDSREAGPGDLFVAVRGLRANGHDFAAAAAAQGAALALEHPVPHVAGSARLRLTDGRRALGELAATLHGRPARRLRVVGVTGTAGKSTTTHMAAHVLAASGVPAGCLSSVAVHAGGKATDNRSGQTTMDAPEVQGCLGRMVAEGDRAAVIEVTSHALAQGRVDACEFDVAAVTNVRSDHLDFHGTQAAYLRTKARLISLCAAAPGKGTCKTAVLNRDDPSYETLAAVPVPRRITYGIDRSADVRALDVGGDGGFRLATAEGSVPVQLSLPCRFNVANALCAAAACLSAGCTVEQVAAGLASFPGVPGRLEAVELGQPFRVYVDYAHSAFGLATVLHELRQAAEGRVLAVFGPTARADHDRPGMGRAAARYADGFVITIDAPLAEDPVELARQVEAGAGGGRYEVILDRRAAIRHSLASARPGDTVLLAGKGHERTMLLAGRSEPWNEREEAIAALVDLGWPAEPPPRPSPAGEGFPGSDCHNCRH